MRRISAGLVALALAVRVVWVLTVRDKALTLSDDANAYHNLAVNVVERHEFGTTVDPPYRMDVPYAQRPPLTPLVLALAYAIFGPHLLAGQLFLAIISTLSVLLLLHFGREFFSEPVAVIAAGLAALYPMFVFLSAVPLTETVATLLFIVLVLVLARGARERTVWNGVLAGCVLGLTALDRPQILGFLPFLLLLLLADSGVSWARRMRWLGVVLVSTALVLSPWTIRNRLVIGAWVPVSLQGGFVLYQGNNPYTQTAITKLHHGSRGWYDDPRYGQALVGASPLERDRRALHLAIEFMQERPLDTAWYSLQKVGIFFSPYANPIARLSWYPILALSLVGVWLASTAWRLHLPLYLITLQTTLTAAFFTSMPRFRAPVEPFFILFAAVAIHRAWQAKSRLQAVK